MIAKERWYLTPESVAVREGHPDARRLLVAAGAEIPDAEARKYGILEETKASYEAKMVSGPAENKALEMPVENKRSRRKVKYPA